MLCTVSLILYHLGYCLSQNAQYCYSYIHNTNITVNILLKQLTLCSVKMTRQEDQKHIFNFVWPNNRKVISLWSLKMGLKCGKKLLQAFENQVTHVMWFIHVGYWICIYTDFVYLHRFCVFIHRFCIFMQILCIYTDFVYLQRFYVFTEILRLFHWNIQSVVQNISGIKFAKIALLVHTYVWKEKLQ